MSKHDWVPLSLPLLIAFLIDLIHADKVLTDELVVAGGFDVGGTLRGLETHLLPEHLLLGVLVQLAA